MGAATFLVGAVHQYTHLQPADNGLPPTSLWTSCLSVMGCGGHPTTDTII